MLTDIGDDLFYHLLLGKMGGVEDAGIGRDSEGADIAAGVAGISLGDLALELENIDDFTAGAELDGAAAGALGWSGIEVKLQLGIGEHHRALIAPLGNQAGALGADFLLLLNEHFADRGNLGDEGSGAGCFAAAEQVTDGFTV